MINLGLGLSPETRAPKHRIKSPKIFPQRVEKQSAKNTKAHKKISPISIALLTTRIFYPQQVTDYPAVVAWFFVEHLRYNWLILQKGLYFFIIKMARVQLLQSFFWANHHFSTLIFGALVIFRRYSKNMISTLWFWWYCKNIISALLFWCSIQTRSKFY